MSGAADATIRPVQSVDEYHACEELQVRAWNFAGERDVVPLTQMLAAHKAGGIVLGAFDAEGELLGFCYGFLGRSAEGRLLHHSHMLAVDDRARSGGLGARLKWAQRQATLDQGIDLMHWTYDPLESLNGSFNFRKLGVVARIYYPNLYGQTTSALHRGTPTDRLLAEWHLDSPRVRARSTAPSKLDAARLADVPRALPARLPDGDLPRPDEPRADLDDLEIVVEVPARIQTVKASDPELALAWRMATRTAFTAYLDRGWIVEECVRPTGDAPLSLYLLRRRDLAGCLASS